MAALDPATVFAPRFNTLGAPWAATGAIASIIYGEMRMTFDIDIIILLDPRSVAALVRTFPETVIYCTPRGVVEIERNRQKRGHFILIHIDSRFIDDVYVRWDDHT